jgi:hypothetical protein
MPWRISAETEAAILGLRERFATWGPRTLLARLALDGPQGKEKMVVRIALAHKLLVRLNAKARETRAAIAQTA